ncbi:MAG: DUF2934 domain-containing protein [Pseudomonadota bacterium]
MKEFTLNESQVREAAYLLWLDEGRPEGRDQEHWLRAVDALTSVQPKRKPARKAASSKPKAAKPAKAAAKSKTARKPRATKAATDKV